MKKKDNCFLSYHKMLILDKLIKLFFLNIPFLN